MDSFQTFERVTVSTELTTEQRKKVRDIVSDIPLVALPNGGRMPAKVTTVEDFIDIMDHVSKFLRREMNAHAETQEQLFQVKADVAAAGRLFKMMSADQS